MTEQGERGDHWVRRRAEKDRKRRQEFRKRLEAARAARRKNARRDTALRKEKS